jgi:hypothetical protein
LVRIAILVIPLLLQAQTPVYQPSIAVAESEYREAQQAWLNSDPNLVNDLFKGNKEEIRGRIHRAASLRDNMMAKKAAYLALMIQRIDDSRKRLASATAPGANLPVEEIKSGLEQEQTRVLSNQDRLEGLLRDLPEGDEYSLVRRELEKERTDLITLQNALALRLHSLDSAARSQQAVQDLSATDAIIEKLDSVKKVWEEEHERTVRQRSAWARLYTSMELEIDRKGSPASVPVVPVAPVSPPPAKAKPVRSEAAPLLPEPPFRSLDGQWTYRSQPGAWSGLAEPEAVSLTLRLSGEQLQGTYDASVPVRGDVRHFRLTLQGKAEDSARARVPWVSKDPEAYGEISLKLGADGRLFVEILSSSDSYVPRGMEVLLPR